MSKIKVQVLYFEGCPHHGPTVGRVRDVIARLGVVADVCEVAVRAGDDCAAMKFAGSPTVLVNGEDIDPAFRGVSAHGFGCRTNDGAGGPPEAMIERALREAAGR